MELVLKNNTENSILEFDKYLKKTRINLKRLFNTDLIQVSFKKNSPCSFEACIKILKPGHSILVKGEGFDYLSALAKARKKAVKKLQRVKDRTSSRSQGFNFEKSFRYKGNDELYFGWDFTAYD